MFSQSPLIFFLRRARSVSLIGPPCYPSGILRSVLADPGCQKQGPGLCGDRRWAPPSAPGAEPPHQVRASVSPQLRFLLPHTCPNLEKPGLFTLKCGLLLPLGK